MNNVILTLSWIIAILIAIFAGNWILAAISFVFWGAVKLFIGLLIVGAILAYFDKL